MALNTVKGLMTPIPMSRMTGVKLTQHLYQSYQLHLQDDTQLGREMQLVVMDTTFMNVYEQ